MNADLNAAKAAKQDEFYTQLVDVEKELRHYAKHFKNKTVLCNCDDYRMSNFFQYFHDNFKNLGLKKLVTTCYKTRQTGLFDSKTEKAVWSEYDGTNLKTGNLNNDGDFRSLECIKILKQSDIIVTNPPFSLFRQYIQQLIKHGKKFLIIGNINAINNKQIFDLIKNDSLWLGASIHSGDREFEVPSNYPLRSVGFRVENDRKYIRVKGVRWFTNLDYEKRHVDLVLTKKYNSKDCPKYDNYDAINVDKTGDIPRDYKGIMGVPITFLDKYNPNQFQILGSARYHDNSDIADDINFINGKPLYSRILIKKL